MNETASKQDQLDAMVSAFEAREQEFKDCLELIQGERRRQRQEFQVKVDHLNSHVKDLMFKLDEKQKACNVLEKQYRYAGEKLTDARSEIDHLEEKIERLTEHGDTDVFIGEIEHLNSKMAKMERELQGSYARIAYGLKLDQEPLCLAVMSGLQRIAPEHNGIIGTDELFELRDKVRDLLERVRLRDAKEEVLLEVPF